MLDIDHFKAINDAYGHPFGDVVIRSVAETAKGELRTNDIACRYGGEELGIVLPRTDELDARRVAERVRLSIENLALPRSRETVRVTVSLGVASIYGGAGGAADLLERADEALYRAKESGRNRVCHG